MSCVQAQSADKPSPFNIQSTGYICRAGLSLVKCSGSTETLASALSIMLAAVTAKTLSLPALQSYVEDIRRLLDRKQFGEGTQDQLSCHVMGKAICYYAV